MRILTAIEGDLEEGVLDRPEAATEVLRVADGVGHEGEVHLRGGPRSRAYWPTLGLETCPDALEEARAGLTHSWLSTTTGPGPVSV